MDRRVAAVLAALHEVSGGLALDVLDTIECQRFSRCYECRLVHYAELAGYALGFTRKPLRNPLHLR